MKKLSENDLNNALISCKLDKKGYFITSTYKNLYGIAEKGIYGGIDVKIGYMTAEKLNEFLRGYLFAKVNKLETPIEKKVYLISSDLGTTTHPDDLTDEEFMQKATEENKIYTMDRFVFDFNNENITDQDFIRII